MNECTPTDRRARSRVAGPLLALSVLLGACDAEETAETGEAAALEEGPAELGLGDEGDEVVEVYRFLRRFGYFPNPALAAQYPGWAPVIDVEPEDVELFDTTLEQALAMYQEAHGLPVSGTLDAATRTTMQQPRCGYPDYYRPRPRVSAAGDRRAKHPPHDAPSGGLPGVLDLLRGASEVAPYTASPYSWASLELKYAFTKYSGDVGADFQRQAVVAAMKTWSAAAPVAWIERGNQDVSISFEPRAHGDGSDFPTNTYAHAGYPWCGSDFSAFCSFVHFNDETYKWGTGNGGAVQDIETIALHELGHVLGLDHSADAGAVMYPTVALGVKRHSLSQDDIDGIRAMYPTYRDLRTFEPFWYLLFNNDVATAYNWAMLGGSFHWLEYGRKEGRGASPGFDVRYYLKNHPDVAQVYGATNYLAAIWHWREYGIGEGRRASPAFDAKYYLNRYPDLQWAYGATNYQAALLHWMQAGIKEGRRASDSFDPVYYLQANPDVAAYYGATNYPAAVYHWLTSGINEGRKTVP